jgi:hypothetical protein
MRANEFIVESDERAIAQAQYMQGKCAVLAITIHKMDPQRFPLGFVYEFFDSMPDIYIEPDEFDELDPARQQDIQYNHQNWSLTHAYVYDVKTQKYIDARGSHDSPPNIGHHFNATRHNKFPAKIQDLVNVSSYMEWDEAQEKWIVLRGWDALDKAYTPEDQQRAREYAIKYLGVEELAEAFDQPYKGKWEKSESGSYDMLVPLPDGSNLNIMFNKEGGNEWQVEFYRNNSQEVTGEGDAQRIFATVLNAIQKFIKKHKPLQITFFASKEVEAGQNSESRAKLYDRLVQRYAASLGYDARIFQHGNAVSYELTQYSPRDHLFTENFADGKNPQDKGDSKRHGVPTKASVSTLRKVAKQGGRKGQLSHWMANMKAGRAKAKRNK